MCNDFLECKNGDAELKYGTDDDYFRNCLDSNFISKVLSHHQFYVSTP